MTCAIMMANGHGLVERKHNMYFENTKHFPDVCSKGEVKHYLSRSLLDMVFVTRFASGVWVAADIDR